jgi:hypothetical protein
LTEDKMANRNFPCNKQYNFHVMPVLVDMQIAIGATGAPTLSGAPGVQSVTRKAAGIYQIQLKDNYASLLGMKANIIEPATGSAIDPNAGVVGSIYEITTVGDTDWSTAGLASSITAAVGARLVLAAQPTAGTGRVKLVSASNLASIELSSNLQNSNNPTQGGAISGTNGAIIIVRCLANTVPVTAGTAGDAVTNNAGVLNSTGGQDLATLNIAADPTEGSKIQISLFLNNSSVQ